MLTLTRRVGEQIAIGDDVEVTVVEITRGKVRLAICAPRNKPILRGEVLARIREENKRAVPNHLISLEFAQNAISFPDGIPGFPELRSFVVADVEGSPVRALVATEDPRIQLLVIEALELAPDYPIERARKLAARADGRLAREECAFALILTLPANGAPCVNLIAPVVIGLDSRVGYQVILDNSGLPVRLELDIPRSELMVGL